MIQGEGLPTIRRSTRAAVAVVVLMSTTACAELWRGPRQVEYTPDRFYIRHVPANTTASTVAELAQDTCAARQKTAVLIADEQYYFFDTRVALYRCLAPGEELGPVAFFPHAVPNN